MATYKKTSIEGAQEKVLFEEVLKQKKKELGDAYEDYKQQTTQQELLKEAARRNLLTIPDPKKHQTISFIKSGIRLASCAFGFYGMFELAFIGLFLAELVGIGEELV